MSERLTNLLGLAATLTILAAPAASEETAWRFDGLDRLYFERLEDPAAAHEGGRVEPALLELLPPILAEGEGMLVEPRVVTDLEGTIHDGLEARDFPLPPQIASGATVFLRQVIDGTHPRLKGAILGLLLRRQAHRPPGSFSTFPEHNDSKLLSPFLIRRLIQGQDGGLTLRATGSVYRPHGAGWQHGVDLLFAVEAGEMRYRYAVRRYSFHFGYDLGEGRSFRIGVEDVVEESGRTVLVRRDFSTERTCRRNWRSLAASIRNTMRRSVTSSARPRSRPASRPRPALRPCGVTSRSRPSSSAPTKVPPTSARKAIGWTSPSQAMQPTGFAGS